MNLSPPRSESPSFFETVRDFQGYFQQHDELPLSVGQVFEIRQFSAGMAYDEQFLQRPQPNTNDRILFILDRMLLPLAKEASIHFSEACLLSYDIGESLIIHSSRRMTLQAKKGDIYVRVADLFKAMIVARIEKVELAPGQKLVAMSGSRRAWKLESEVTATLKGLLDRETREIPSRFQAHVRFNEEKDCSIKPVKAQYGHFGFQTGLEIQATHGMTFSVEENEKNYLFSMEDFRQYMQLKGELRLPAGQVLKICDPSILELNAEYERIPYLAKITENFGFFVFNQILLPLGKTLTIRETGLDSVSYKFEYVNDSVILSSENELVLVTDCNPLIANFQRFGQIFIKNNLSFVKLQPEQGLILYDLFPEQSSHLDAWVRNEESSVVIKGLEQFFLPYNPTGFKWKIQMDHLRLRSLEWDGQPVGLLLQPKNRSEKIELERLSGSWLVVNLLNDSCQELAEGIKESDENAFIYLLFKAIFYYCQDDFRDFCLDELPTFFKKATRDQLEELLADNGFTDSLASVFQDKEMHLQLLGILRMTPTKFKELNRKALFPPLKDVLQKITQVIYEELRGSTFLINCVREVQIGLENGTIQHFLRPQLVGPSLDDQKSSK